MNYSIQIVPSAEKVIAGISGKIKVQVLKKISALSYNPRPRGAIKLAGDKNFYRIRSGDWRVVYTIQDDKLIVLVVRIGHRREVYR